MNQFKFNLQLINCKMNRFVTHNLIGMSYICKSNWIASELFPPLFVFIQSTLRIHSSKIHHLPHKLDSSWIRQFCDRKIVNYKNCKWLWKNFIAHNSRKFLRPSRAQSRSIWHITSIQRFYSKFHMCEGQRIIKFEIFFNKV